VGRNITEALNKAWAWRKRAGLFDDTEALRVFYGPGESASSLVSLAIDKFGDHFWLTWWEPRGGEKMDEEIRAAVNQFLIEKGAKSAVLLHRPFRGTPETPTAFFGEVPKEPFAVTEYGAKFLIRMCDNRHPGLFLDHAPLRRWLRDRSKGLRVLNTFSYTGSLSVAAGLGGASEVVSVDLSKPTSEWAEANWKANGLSDAHARFIAGDIFEWWGRLKKNGPFDIVILDPPSFSRGKKGAFSVVRDFERLHSAALSVLAPGGWLVTSSNSEELTWAAYETKLRAATATQNLKLNVVSLIGLPESFPTQLGRPDDRYLKGFIAMADMSAGS
jgi:23S rRNA (cytosine1962-C5)-methyltransferase